MQFYQRGGATLTRYNTKAGVPKTIEVGNFLLVDLKKDQYFLLPGNVIVKSMEK